MSTWSKRGVGAAPEVGPAGSPGRVAVVRRDSARPEHPAAPGRRRHARGEALEDEVIELRLGRRPVHHGKAAGVREEEGRARQLLGDVEAPRVEQRPRVLARSLALEDERQELRALGHGADARREARPVPAKTQVVRAHPRGVRERAGAEHHEEALRQPIGEPEERGQPEERNEPRVDVKPVGRHVRREEIQSGQARANADRPEERDGVAPPVDGPEAHPDARDERRDLQPREAVKPLRPHVVEELPGRQQTPERT